MNWPGLAAEQFSGCLFEIKDPHATPWNVGVGASSVPVSFSEVHYILVPASRGDLTMCWVPPPKRISQTTHMFVE